MLDANVLSAIRRRQPDQEVAASVSTQPEELLFTASVCQAEILAGIETLPDGRRRRNPEAAARAIFGDDFDGRILPFDATAASLYANLFAIRKKAARSTVTADLMIAAVALACGAHIVTRNVADFEGCGLILINPWEAPEARFS